MFRLRAYPRRPLSWLVAPLALGAALALASPAGAFPFSGHHRQKGLYYAAAPVMAAPIYGYGPMAPVVLGAASTMSVNYAAAAPVQYPAPVQAAAPVAITAQAPATTVFYGWPGANGAAGAPPAGFAGAPSAELTQVESNSIVEDLIELKEELKDEGLKGSGRRKEMVERALELIADYQGTSADDLKATDRLLARRLVDQALGAPSSTAGAMGLSPGLGQAWDPRQAAAPAGYGYAPGGYGHAPFVVQPVPAAVAYPAAAPVYPLVPLVPATAGKPCGHRLFCLCKH